MQYPQIQFYRGSLVRLESGQLKQVEDLSSDDFLESAKAARFPGVIDTSVVRDFLEVSNTHPANNITNHLYHPEAQGQTVLIKFFLESSRTIVFIEVPTEHPFFVLHRGWSSWNPQRTDDIFGLKCRKLKIGDTCISLINSQQRKQQQHQQNDQSDQHNIIFSHSFKTFK